MHPKLLERHVSAHLRLHLQSNDLEDPFQSAYRWAHSVETAIVCIQDDILRSLDMHKRSTCTAGRRCVWHYRPWHTVNGSTSNRGTRRRTLLARIVSYRPHTMRQCRRSLVSQNPTATRSSTGQCVGPSTFHCLLRWPVIYLRNAWCSLPCVRWRHTTLCWLST